MEPSSSPHAQPDVDVQQDGLLEHSEAHEYDPALRGVLKEPRRHWHVFKVPRSLADAPIRPLEGLLGRLPLEIVMMVIEASQSDNALLNHLCFIMSCCTLTQLYGKMKEGLRIPKPQSLHSLYILKTIWPGATFGDRWLLCYVCSQYRRKDLVRKNMAIEERRCIHERLMTVSDFYWGCIKMQTLSKVPVSHLCAECRCLAAEPMRNPSLPHFTTRPVNMPWTRRPLDLVNPDDPGTSDNTAFGRQAME